jgi:hypothetical protein
MYKKQDDLGRFSDPSLLILASGPKHGYAMMEDIFQFCGTRLEPGTLYAAFSPYRGRDTHSLMFHSLSRPGSATCSLPVW